jgi:hypothetical protein
MQKVEGSNPFSRLVRDPASVRDFVVSALLGVIVAVVAMIAN